MENNYLILLINYLFNQKLMERLYQLGIDKELISIIGNAKYDLIPSGSSKIVKI